MVTEHSNRLLGFTPEEILGQSYDFFINLIYEEDFVSVLGQKQNSFEEDRLFTLEFRMYNRLQEIRFVRDQYICFRNPDDTWVMEGCLTEVVQPKIRDRVLLQLAAYRNAIDVNMISSITNRQGKIIYVNQNFCDVSKFTMHELIGQKHNIVNSGHHTRDFFTELWRTISSGKTWHGEILNKAKDGTKYWVDTVIIPIFDEDKKITSYLSLRTLINERKKAEHQRRRYTHLLGQVAFIVAHNVRSPLCSIMGLTNILLYNKNTPEENKQIVTYLHESSAKLNEITKALSRFVYEHEVETNLEKYIDEQP